MIIKNNLDGEMILQLQNNEESVVWKIFNTYWESLFLLAFSIVKDRAIAEDIVQSTLINIWEKRSTLVIQHSLKAYLNSSVRYAAYKEWKLTFTKTKESIHSLDLAHNESALDNLAYQDLLIQVNKVVDELPLRCREVYLLSREEQLSHKEIAQRMNISTKTVENQLTKALRLLRKSLEDVPLAAVLFLF